MAVCCVEPLSQSFLEECPISFFKYRSEMVCCSRTIGCARKCAALCAAVVAGVSIGMAGCHSAPKLTQQQIEGKHVYDVGCAHCHELNDLGLKKVPPNLHGLFDRSKLPDGEPATDAEVEHVLMTGKGMMPSFEYQLSKEQTEALLAFLHTGMQDEPSKDAQDK